MKSTAGSYFTAPFSLESKPLRPTKTDIESTWFCCKAVSELVATAKATSAAKGVAKDVLNFNS